MSSYGNLSPIYCSLSRFEAIPDKMSPDEILKQAQKAAKIAADRLTLRAPNSKVSFKLNFDIDFAIS